MFAKNSFLFFNFYFLIFLRRTVLDPFFSFLIVFHHMTIPQLHILLMMDIWVVYYKQCWYSCKCILVRVCTSFPRGVLGSKAAESWGCISSTTRYCQTSFQRSYTNLHPLQQHLRVPIDYMLLNTWYCQRVFLEQLC